jgi:hypothetical protein
MRSSKVFQQALSAVEALNVGTSSFLPSWILEVRKASHRWQLPWLRNASYFQHSLHGELSFKPLETKGLAMTTNLGDSSWVGS